MNKRIKSWITHRQKSFRIQFSNNVLLFLYISQCFSVLYLLIYAYFSLTPPTRLFSPAGYQHWLYSVLAVSFGVLFPLTPPNPHPHLSTCILFPHHILLKFGLIYCVGLSVSVLSPIIGTQLLIYWNTREKWLSSRWWQAPVTWKMVLYDGRVLHTLFWIHGKVLCDYQQCCASWRSKQVGHKVFIYKRSRTYCPSLACNSQQHYGPLCASCWEFFSQQWCSHFCYVGAFKTYAAFCLKDQP